MAQMVKNLPAMWETQVKHMIKEAFVVLFCLWV